MIGIIAEDGTDQDMEDPLEEACPDIATGTGIMNVIGGNTKWGGESIATEKDAIHILTEQAQIGIIEPQIGIIEAQVLVGNQKAPKKILISLLLKSPILRLSQRKREKLQKDQNKREAKVLIKKVWEVKQVKLKNLGQDINDSVRVTFKNIY